MHVKWIVTVAVLHICSKVESITILRIILIVLFNSTHSFRVTGQMSIYTRHSKHTEIQDYVIFQVLSVAMVTWRIMGEGPSGAFVPLN